jgi:predicted nucleic acid-binding protein
LARKCKARQVTRASLQQKIQELEADWQNFVQIQLTVEVIDRAKTLAKTLALRGADSIHLASAVVLQSRLFQDDRLVFITSDQELKVAAQTSALTTLDPTEEEAKPLPQILSR